MIQQEKKFIAEEYPQVDKYQLIMLTAFMTVWVTDSFVLKATLLEVSGPWYLWATFGALILLSGTYLVNESHKLVIDSREPRFIDWGVYAFTRHPMYLGILLVYLGLAVSTVSITSMLVLIVAFFVYDWIANYEETQLIETLGIPYLEYCGRTHRWKVY